MPAQPPSLHPGEIALALLTFGGLALALLGGVYLWLRNRWERWFPGRLVRRHSRMRRVGRPPAQRRKNAPRSRRRSRSRADVVVLPIERYQLMLSALRDALPIVDAYERGELVRVSELSEQQTLVTTGLDEAPDEQALKPRQATQQAMLQLVQPVSLPGVPGTLDALPFLLTAGQQWATVSLSAGQHWGVYGTSQSGKGNLLQLIALAALDLGPALAQVWVLDPKDGLDYAEFALHCRHARLYADVDGTDGSLNDGYQAAETEMKRRHQLMLRTGPVSRNVREYNRRAAEPLPYLMLIADEVSQLTSPQRATLDSLARMGAASGLVLFVATQYPTAEYLSSQVQANVLNRVVFMLPNAKYTKVALGLEGNEPYRYEPAAITQPGIAIVRANRGPEVLGRVPEMTDQVRLVVIADLLDRYPRLPSVVVSVADTQSVSKVSSLPATNQDGSGSFLQVLLETDTGETSGEKRSDAGENGSQAQEDFTAAGGDFTPFTLQFSPTEIAQITARILSGENKTPIVKGMSGYHWKKHQEYAGYYDMFYAWLRANGFGDQIDEARKQRAALALQPAVVLEQEETPA